MKTPSPLLVRRSGWKMWLVALAGIPLLVAATDVLTQRRLTDALRGLLFRPDDTQVFEARDLIWAWVMLAVGILLTGWGLKELLAPTIVVRSDADGLALGVRGPFRAPWVVPWSQVDDIGETTLDDDGVRVPVMWVRVMDPSIVPSSVWNGRRVDDRTVAIFASDWEIPPGDVARRAVEWAVASVSATFDDPEGSAAADPTGESS